MAGADARDRVQRDVTARGVRTRVVEAGAEDAPALVLIHGFLTSHREFDDTIDRFAASHHVIAPDLPGFGESEKPNPSRYPYGVEAGAEAVADVIAAFGVGRAAVVGRCFGGAIALTLAAQHSELVQRLVVEDPVCYPAPLRRLARWSLAPLVGGIFFKQLCGRGLFRAHFRHDVASAAAPLPLARVDAYYDSFNSPAARESAYAVLRAMLDTRPVVARITRIAVPTLVVWGREDRITPVAQAHRLVRELPNAKLEILEAGHSPHEELPGPFVELVTEFLAGKRGR